MPHPEKALSEIDRVLREGGLLLSWRRAVLGKAELGKAELGKKEFGLPE